MPKVTFAAKETYQEVQNLSQKIPIWDKAAQNPINNFIPYDEKPVKPMKAEDEGYQAREAARLQRLTSLQGKERSLQLAGTMALSKRPCSPLSKLKETRGMVTLKTVPDLFEQRNSYAKVEYQKLGYKYEAPKQHVFRSTDPGEVLGFGQIDMQLRTHPN